MENSEARKRKEETKYNLTPAEALEAIADSLEGTITVLKKVIEALEGRSNASDQQG